MTGKRAGLRLAAPGDVEAQMPVRFRVRVVWTRHPMRFRVWKPSWWRAAWMTWARWAEAWAVMGWQPNQVESTCVAFGPFVIVVEHPRPRQSER